MNKRPMRTEPNNHEIDAAARAWFEWQFQGRRWDEAPPTMQAKFKEGALRSLQAAYDSIIDEKAVASN